ncbi:hypothetical protein HanRHA438_Chr13g0611191 [Helianthus annuus]|nr:hypothetical protein HanRHA438_Chr13g0611191 [Helianthus annuus]
MCEYNLIRSDLQRISGRNAGHRPNRRSIAQTVRKCEPARSKQRSPARPVGPAGPVRV